MKKLSGGIVALIIVIAIVVVGGIWAFSSYNGLATSFESVATGQASIDTQLQRRGDLIPNLVATVKSFAAHETEVIDSVTDARAKLSGAGTMAEKAEADGELSSALSRLMVVVENYPELKSDATYVSLMDELAGTENRIAVARDDYNTTVQGYNNKVITFPGRMFAGMFGFEKAEYFKAAEGSQTAPNVSDLF